MYVNMESVNRRTETRVIRRSRNQSLELWSIVQRECSLKTTKYKENFLTEKTYSPLVDRVSTDLTVPLGPKHLYIDINI